MSGVPFVRMYANDWFTGCVGLKADERGVYISMCVYIWTAGRRIPLDDAEAARMMCLQFNNYQRIRNALVSKGKVQVHDDGYGIKRAEKELDCARNRAEAGGPARDGRRVDADASASDAEGTESADQVRSEIVESAEAGRAILGTSAGAQAGTLPCAQVGAPVGTPAGSGQNDEQNQHPSNDLIFSKEEVSTPLPPKGGPTPLDALKAFEAYNAVALRCAIPQSSKLTPDKQRKIIARLKEYGLDGWHQALANIEKSSFLTGNNDKGWRASLDFMLQAGSFSKLHDGAYGNGRHSAKAGAPVPAYQVPTRAPQRRQADLEAEWTEEAIKMGIA